MKFLRTAVNKISERYELEPPIESIEIIQIRYVSRSVKK